MQDRAWSLNGIEDSAAPIRNECGEMLGVVLVFHDAPLADAAVRCFVDVARVVGVKTVAEFADRVEVLGRMHELGIDFAQGFLLHRPEPIGAMMGIPTQPV